MLQNSQKIVLFLSVIIGSQCFAYDSAQLHPVSNLTPLTNKAFINTTSKNCYRTETGHYQISGKNKDGYAEGLNSPPCKANYAAVDVGGWMKAEELSHGVKTWFEGYPDLIRTVSHANSVRCCPVEYRWE